jgi:protoheme IX farnesyltransferase
VFLTLAWRVFRSTAGDAADPRPADRDLYEVGETEAKRDKPGQKAVVGDARHARNLFAFSILYLFALFAALLAEAVLGLPILNLHVLELPL